MVRSIISGGGTDVDQSEASTRPARPARPRHPQRPRVEAEDRWFLEMPEDSFHSYSLYMKKEKKLYEIVTVLVAIYLLLAMHLLLVRVGRGGVFIFPLYDQLAWKVHVISFCSAGFIPIPAKIPPVMVTQNRTWRCSFVAPSSHIVLFSESALRWVCHLARSTCC